MHYIIAGDVGGTNSRLALFASEEDDKPAFNSFKEHFKKVYPSKIFGGLAELVSTFLQDAQFNGVIHGCCIAVCGPVENEDRMVGPELKEQRPTTWKASSVDLKTGILEGRILEAVLINDFIAVGLGLTVLPDSDVEVLHAGNLNKKAPMACVGAGTGLGEVFLTWKESEYEGFYEAWPSEGGMTEFTARDDKEWALRKHIIANGGFPTVESVVSGPGICKVYRFLCDQNPDVRPVVDLSAGNFDGSIQKAVSEYGLAKSDPICEEALAIMLRSWGAECRSVAMRTMCHGGLYLAGGLTPRLLPAIREVLVDSYLNGDKLMGNLISGIPLLACKNDAVGMLGAQVRAFRLVTKLFLPSPTSEVDTQKRQREQLDPQASLYDDAHRITIMPADSRKRRRCVVCCNKKCEDGGSLDHFRNGRLVMTGCVQCYALKAQTKGKKRKKAMSTNADQPNMPDIPHLKDEDMIPLCNVPRFKNFDCPLTCFQIYHLPEPPHFVGCRLHLDQSKRKRSREA